MTSAITDWNAELLEAIGEQDVERVRAALAHGADPNATYEEQPFRGETALYDAVFVGNEEIVEMLLERGANVAAEAPEDGATSLHIAAEHGDRSILRRLLQTDIGPHLGTFDYIERTPLHCAVRRGDVEAARMLLEAGADVNAVNEERIGESALADAAEGGWPEMVELLLVAGADPLRPGWVGKTPLDRARNTRDPNRIRIREMLEAAVKKRADNHTFRHDTGHPRRRR